MEVTTYSSQQTPALQQPKRRLAGSGATWGLLFGLFGGSASALALAMTYAIEVWIDSGSFNDAVLAVALLVIIGGPIGGIFGAIVGLVAGFFLGLARFERAARWVTAAICAALPLLAVAEILETVPRDQGDLARALLLTALFAMIGYFTGAGFEGRLTEDARWKQ